jgi:hypothetical protein
VRTFRRFQRARALWLLYALLQLTLPGVASWADARAEAASLAGAARPHVEDHGTAQCPRVHGPDCAICHFLSTFAQPTQAPAVPAPRPRRVAPPALLAGSQATAYAALHRSRAPPHLA